MTYLVAVASDSVPVEVGAQPWANCVVDVLRNSEHSLGEICVLRTRHAHTDEVSKWLCYSLPAETAISVGNNGQGLISALLDAVEYHRDCGTLLVLTSTDCLRGFLREFAKTLQPPREFRFEPSLKRNGEVFRISLISGIIEHLEVDPVLA